MCAKVLYTVVTDKSFFFKADLYVMNSLYLVCHVLEGSVCRLHNRDKQINKQQKFKFSISQLCYFFSSYPLENCFKESKSL